MVSSRSVPILLGMLFRNQMWAMGEARWIWPIRSLPDLRLYYLDAALLADDAAVLHPLVFAADALIVFHGPKIRAQKRPSFSGLKVR